MYIEKIAEENGTVRNISYGLKMLPDVPRHYFRKKGEMGTAMEALKKDGYAMYRTPLICECTDCGNYRQHGVVVVSMEGKVVIYLIKCGNCAQREEDV